jgi:thiol-disulfide isomerase/thioredoxin
MVIKLSEFAKNGYKIILLNAAAGWCGPCQQETAGFKSLAAKYPELGIYQVLFDNVKQGQTPTLSFLNQWVKTLKPAGAVGIDPERNIVPINTGGSTPLNMIIDAKTLKVLKKFNGAPATGLNSVIAPYFK